MQRQPTKHPTQTKRPKVVNYRVIREWKREHMNGLDRDYGNFIVWWVVQWTRQEKLTLEKRRLYIRKDGGVKTYQCLGWNQADMEWMKEHRAEIEEALNN